MIPFWLLTWKAKAVGIGVLIAAALWYFQHAKTAAYEQGARDARPKIWAEAEAALKAQVDEELRRLSEDAERLNEIDRQQRIERQTIERDRAALTAGVSRQLADIARRNVEDRQNVANVIGPDLVPAIRTVLRELQSVEAERARSPGIN